MTLEGGLHHYSVCVTNDRANPAPVLEPEQRHKAQLESGVHEPKENFGFLAVSCG